MVRLFAAVAIPDEIGMALMKRQKGIEGARWRPLDALHVTLRFFGDVREDVARDLDSELIAVSGRPFEMALEGAGAFG
jgi:2'-5' RNA ligase